MIDLAQAKITYDNGNERYLRMYHKGFEIEFQTYGELKGGIDYKYSSDYQTRRNWWIFSIKIIFDDKKLHKKWGIDGGYKLCDVEKNINKFASNFIKERFKEFL